MAVALLRSSLILYLNVIFATNDCFLFPAMVTLRMIAHSRLWLPDVGARAVALVQSNDAPILSAWPYVIPRQSFEEAQVQARCRRHLCVSKPCKHPAQVGKEASGLRIFFSPIGLGFCIAVL